MNENGDNLTYSTGSISLTFLNDGITLCIRYLLYTVICQVMDIFGIGFNIINITCFVEQGFKDPVNISLLGLAVSDIGSLATLLWLNICYTPGFVALDLPFDSIEVSYLTAGMPHTVFTRISGWVTAFITLERCLCVTLPLKVKTIITARRSFLITVIIFIILISSIVPEYLINSLNWKYFPELNKTLIGLVYKENRGSITKVSYVINNVLIPSTSFAVIIICTMILVVKIRSGTSWNETSINNAQAERLTKRNQQLSKMIVMISTLFIACFIPLSVMFLAVSLEPEFFINGKYRNLCLVIGGFALTLESINSSVNIFIYYRMSSKFRSTFCQLFKLDK